LRIKIDKQAYDRLPPDEQREVDRALAELEQLRQDNPLEFFEPHGPEQRAFFEARTKIVAAFAGNRFGKSTALVVRALIECVDTDCLPERLRAYKTFDAPTHAWMLCPTEEKIFDSLKPAFEQWCPKSQFAGGAWGKAYNGARMMLSFANGSTIAFKTYKQDPSTLGGAALHFVGYDEPPPREHRDECLTRLAGAKGGYEMYAMTPLKANTGWIRRDIYKNREAPHITVVRGSMHDNPTLDEETKNFILGQYASDIWRRAREYGDFVDVGGLIYPDFERCVLPEPPSPERIRASGDVIVTIDPGIRNAGIVWECFERDNVCGIFDELLLQDSTPTDYAAAIRRKNERWGLTDDDVTYVIDPAARQRGQTNAETVMNLLAVEGIHCIAGQNDVEAGISQGRTRMAHGRLWISPECRGLRDEADDYAAQEPGEGRDDSHLVPVKGNDHRLDAARYGWMERVWDPQMEETAPQRTLGWQPGKALSATDLSNVPTVTDAPPMGAMS
jgi:phage terminase large subunit-like protein